MTLHRRSLNPPASLADIAISALSGQKQYGAVTQIAHDYGLTRQSVYRLRDTGHQALLASFTPEVPSAWTPDVPEAAIKRSIVGLYSVAACSMDDIVDLLPILFAGKTHSHGYIFNVLREAKENAAAFLETVDLSPIQAVAIDEMFWHQTPLFTGIDLDTGYLFSSEKVQRCSGAEWISRLQTLKVNGFDPASIILPCHRLAQRDRSNPGECRLPRHRPLRHARWTAPASEGPEAAEAGSGLTLLPTPNGRRDRPI